MAVEFPSYVDDLHHRLYDMGCVVRGLDEVERQERMEDLLNRVLVVLK